MPGMAGGRGATGTQGAGVRRTGGSLQADSCPHPPFSRGQALLLCDEYQTGGAMKDDGIARSLKAGSAAAERVRPRCVVEDGLEAAPGRKRQVTAVRRNPTVRESPA